MPVWVFPVVCLMHCWSSTVAPPPFPAPVLFTEVNPHLRPKPSCHASLSWPLNTHLNLVKHQWKCIFNHWYLNSHEGDDILSSGWESLGSGVLLYSLRSCTPMLSVMLLSVDNVKSCLKTHKNRREQAICEQAVIRWNIQQYRFFIPYFVISWRIHL